MPQVPAAIRSGDSRPGGSIKGYPADKIYDEIAFISYYFHWDRDRIMNMEHRERQQWCLAISNINKQMNAAGRQAAKGREISLQELR